MTRSSISTASAAETLPTLATASLSRSVACKAGDDARVRRWLVALALHYEYGDNRETHETAAAATLAADAGGLIPANDPNLLALAELVGVQQPSDSASSTEPDDSAYWKFHVSWFCGEVSLQSWQ